MEPDTGFVLEQELGRIEFILKSTKGLKHIVGLSLFDIFGDLIEKIEGEEKERGGKLVV